MRIIAPEELLPDGVEILKFTIPGQPATKKTSQRILSGRILPSKAYCLYETYCRPFCDAAWVGTGKQPMDFGVAVGLKVYLKSWVVGDATGYMQSIADIMQKYGVVTNDSWIHWDSRDDHWFAGVDSVSPRVEILISRLRHPREAFRANKEAEEEAKEARRIAKNAFLVKSDP